MSIELGLITKLKEIDPGVRVPAKTTYDILRREALRNGIEIVGDRMVIKIDKVNLHPADERSVFTNIKIPEGKTEMRFKDGMVYRTYRQRHGTYHSSRDITFVMSAQRYRMAAFSERHSWLT